MNYFRWMWKLISGPFVPIAKNLRWIYIKPILILMFYYGWIAWGMWVLGMIVVGPLFLYPTPYLVNGLMSNTISPESVAYLPVDPKLLEIGQFPPAVYVLTQPLCAVISVMIWIVLSSICYWYVYIRMDQK